MKPNTKVWDRMIKHLEVKLTAVRNQELWPLTAGEKARLAGNGYRGARRVMKGKDPARAERAIDAIFAGAEERYASELTEAKKARQKVIGDAAAVRVAKRAESKWW